MDNTFCGSNTIERNHYNNLQIRMGQVNLNRRKRILFFPYAHQFGSTAPLIEMARFLKQQGHDVLVAGEGPYMKLATYIGLDTEKVVGVPYDVFRKYMDLGRYNRVFSPEYLELMLADDQKLIKNFKPDFMIHYFRFSVPVAGHINNVKSAGIMYANITHWYSGYIDFPRLEPKMNLIRRIPFSRIFLKGWPIMSKLVMDGYLKELDNYVANKWPTWKKQGYYKLVCGADYTLILDCKDLFPVQKKAHLVQLGPIIHNLLAKSSNRDGRLVKKYVQAGYKVIFIDLGSSTPNKLHIVREILQIMGDYNSYAILVAQFNEDLSVLKKEFIGMRGRLIIKDLFNVHEIGPYIDLIITHGGKGSIYDALAYNMIPLVIPNQVEQELNGIVLKKYKLGDLYYKGQPFSMLGKKIDRLIKNSDFFHKNIANFSNKVDNGLWKKELLKLVNRI